MQEKELIHKIQELRQIKPRKDWVVLTKERILAEEPKISLLPFFRYRYKLVFVPVTVISVLIIIGLFGFAQNTVPGDFLFPVKKVTEIAQVSFSSSVEKPTAHLKLANKRLEDLSKITQANQVRNLGPAIEEFQASIVEATKGLIEMDVNVTSSDPMILQEIVAETQKLEENKEKIEAVLGTMIGDTRELENAISQLEKQMAVYLIADLENRTLTEEDQKLLEEAKENFEAGDYFKALENIWLLSN